MIRINLLPTKAKEKEKTIKAELIFAAILIAIVVIGCYLIDKRMTSQIQAEKEKINKLTIEISQYQADIQRVEEFKRKRNDLNAKLNAIKDLDTRRSGPVKMMDEFATIIPKKMWIMSFRENNKKLELEGIATDGPVISDFLDKLRNSQYFEGAQLIQTQQTTFDGKAMQRFNVVCQVKYSI
jgi:type IV pilus assembly protein PilN